MKRRPTAELLDTDSGTPAEIAASIRDLRWFNRWFGGVSTTRNLVEVVARNTGENQFSLLEVAAGEGFVPQSARVQLERLGIGVSVTLLDRVCSHLPKNGPVHKIASDALALPFSDSTFDLVSSSLFAHHLAPEQVVQFAGEALRVCRLAVLVNDLVRHPIHLAVAYAGTPLYHSRITRHDALASVRQAYTVSEMKGLLQKAGAARIEAQSHYFFRMGVIAWKREPDK